MQPRLVSARTARNRQDRNLEALDRSAAFLGILSIACSMGCASTSVADSSASVLEEANPNTASTGGYMAKVHPLRRMDALDKNNCNLTSLPCTPTSDGGRTEIMDSGYHDLKRMSQMSNDSIESMVQHLVEEKPREQVITEVMSLAHELVAMEQEAVAEPPPEKPNSQDSAQKQELEIDTKEEQNEEENQVPDTEMDGASKEVEAPAEPKEEENNVPGKVEEQEKEEEMDEQIINEPNQDEEVEDEVPAVEAEEAEIIPVAADSTRSEDENASAEDPEEAADAAKDAEPAVDAEDDTSSKLHFEMSSEDIDMLEAQLRELSAPTPSPVPSAPAAPEEHVDTPELAKTPLPEEDEQIELTPVVDFCSAEKDEINSLLENDGKTPPPPLVSSLESEEGVTGGKSEM